MCGYVIKRLDQGGGFLRPPPHNGWTNRLELARRYSTYAEAKHECAENEAPVNVLDLLQPTR